MPSSSSSSYRGAHRQARHRPALAPVQPGHDPPADPQRVGLVDGDVVGQAADPAVHDGPAELLLVGDLAGGHPHQRRTAQEHLRAAVDHHDVVAHAGHVRAAGGGVAEDQRDRRDAGGREPGEVAEDLPARDEDLLLRGQVGAAGLDQVDQRQPVLPGDLHRPQRLLQRPRVARAAADRRVVGDQHALDALDHADAGDDAGADGEVACPTRPAGRARGTGCRGRAAARSARGAAACRASGAGRPAFSPPPASAFACSASRAASASSIASRLAANCADAVSSVERWTLTGSSSGISSVRLSSHSPTALPCGSKRVLAATPRPSSPSITTLTARRFGSGWTATGRSAASGSSSRTRSRGERRGQPGGGLVGAGPDADVRRPALVAAAGPRHGAERRPAGRSRQSCSAHHREQSRLAGGTSSSARVPGRRGDVHAGAVGQDGDVRHVGLRHVGRRCRRRTASRCRAAR